MTLNPLENRNKELKDIIFTILQHIIDKDKSSYGPINGKKPKYGDICSKKYITFNDGSLFKFRETIDGNRKITYCIYRYIRPKTGFFFEYDDEGAGSEIPFKKPRNHWHVGIIENKGIFPILKQKIDNKEFDEELFNNFQKELGDHHKEGLHYDAPTMNLERFLCIIVTNFFDKDENSEKILGELTQNQKNYI